jgi:hypothetical protein
MCERADSTARHNALHALLPGFRTPDTPEEFAGE